jgi:stalled ribosome rescue protein Dom34
MKTKKNISIWLDHSEATLIDLENEKNNCTIKSKFTIEVKEEALSRSENIMHNKEQQMHESFYKEIADKILNYDHILLFGPTNAKAELHNFLKEDLHFEDVKIDIESSDKMLEKERKAFAVKFFKNSLSN